MSVRYTAAPSPNKSAYSAAQTAMPSYTQDGGAIRASKAIRFPAVAASTPTSRSHDRGNTPESCSEWMPATAAAPVVPIMTARAAQPPPDLGGDEFVYDALSQDPASVDDLLHQTGLRLTDLCTVLQRLARAGVARDLGGWWVRI